FLDDDPGDVIVAPTRPRGAGAIERDARYQHIGVWIAAIALPLLGAAVVLLVTRDGPGLSPDSRGYLVAAELAAHGQGVSIRSGDGKIVPLTHLAPLYALLMVPA